MTYTIIIFRGNSLVKLEAQEQDFEKIQAKLKGKEYAYAYDGDLHTHTISPDGIKEVF